MSNLGFKNTSTDPSSIQIRWGFKYPCNQVFECNSVQQSWTSVQYGKTYSLTGKTQNTYKWIKPYYGIRAANIGTYTLGRTTTVIDPNITVIYSQSEKIEFTEGRSLEPLEPISNLSIKGKNDIPRGTSIRMEFSYLRYQPIK